MSATLLEIGSDVQALATLLDEIEGGELTPDAEQALDAWFAELADAREQKLDGYCALVRTLALRAAARREESDRLAKLVQAEENKAKALKDRLKLFLEMTGERKIETARYRIALCGNGGKMPVAVDVPATELPELYQRVTVAADVDLLRAAMEAGAEIAGCRLLPRGQHVRIS